MRFTYLIGFIFVVLSSCIISRTARLSNCEFSYKDIAYLKANNINLLGKDELTDLSMQESFSLSKALAEKSLKMDLQMNIDIENPNDKKAVLNTVDWILQVKKKDVLEGSTQQRIEVLPNGGKATLPLKANFDLFKILENYTLTEATDILWNIASNPDNPDVFTFKIKPSFQIAGQQVKYPGYIKINY